MGIEPTAQAWEAWVLPLYDARSEFGFYAPCDGSSKSVFQKGKGALRRRPSRPQIALTRSGEQQLEKLVVHFQLQCAADNAGEVLRRRIREVTTRAGQCREWWLLVEHVIDDEPSLKLRRKFHAER